MTSSSGMLVSSVDKWLSLFFYFIVIHLIWYPKSDGDYNSDYFASGSKCCQDQNMFEVVFCEDAMNPVVNDKFSGCYTKTYFSWGNSFDRLYSEWCHTDHVVCGILEEFLWSYNYQGFLYVLWKCVHFDSEFFCNYNNCAVTDLLFLGNDYRASVNPGGCFSSPFEMPVADGIILFV